MLGIDADGLQQTVSRFNGFAKRIAISASCRLARAPSNVA
jgi:hypothetical protein